MPATLSAITKGFQAEVGYIEGPPPHHTGNLTKYGKWYGLDAQPWCAMFVSWVFYMAGLPLPASTAKGFAWCPSGAEWFMRQGRWGKVPKLGAVIFYRFGARIDHVGWVLAFDGEHVWTIEGNTSAGDSGSQTNGGGVYRRRRRRDLAAVAGYGYPDYSPEQEDDDMGIFTDKADFERTMRGLLGPLADGWQDGSPAFVDDDKRRFAKVVPGTVLWVTASAGIKVRSAWLNGSGAIVGDVSEYEPGPAGVAGNPPAGVEGFYIERTAGSGPYTVQLFAPNEGG